MDPHDLSQLVEHLASDPALASALRVAGSGRRVLARGAAGSSTSFVAGALARRAGKPVVLVVAHLDDADEAADELASAGVPALKFPAIEVLPGETGASLELFGQRVGAVRRVLELLGPAGGAAAGAPVIVCPVQALMQGVPDPARLGLVTLELRPGDARGPTAVIDWLAKAGYVRVDAVEEPGEFAVRGGIIDVFPPGGSASAGGATVSVGVPVRLDFFGDELERLSEIDTGTMGSDRRLDSVELVCMCPQEAEGPEHPEESSPSFLTLIPPDAVVVLSETSEIIEQARGYYERVSHHRSLFGPPEVFRLVQERFGAVVEINQFGPARAGGDAAAELPVSPLPEFPPDASAAVAQLGELAGTHAVLACCSSAGELSRLQELLTEFAPGAGQVVPLHAYCHRGFVWNDPGSGPAGGRRPVAVVPYHELLHRFQTRRRFRAGSTRLRAGRAVDTFLDIKPGDIVVHRDHGLAKFVGLTLLEPASARVSAAARLRRPGPRKAAADADLEEYLTLEFAHGAKLHVPATTIDQVQRYVGAARGGAPSLSVLGGERWKRQKQEAAESVRGLASELLRVRAAREHLPGTRFPADTPWQREFEAEFPFEETEDQLAALQEIKRDMQTARPMDRLLCGDVGYGKTELALRAAFKAAEFGRQVAVLVPTTVLAEQHERTMRARLAGYPFRIESLSRLKSAKQVNETLAAVRKGHVDVVVGTHRLLSKDVRFADLGLLVVDEEQRFGVEHKERLLALRLTVDVLTMSATPIPRTLHMAMLGLRDISTLSTPPLDRRAVVTEVVPYSERRIQQAIARELAREGQVYFVHNRVHNIRQVAERVRALAPPAARVVIGHGQMEPKELEGVMLAFMRREADILVCTTIIESGIDNPTANTIIISDADRFGLSDLHQLRGRVGRYKHRAYCYLLLPESRPVTEKARRRLRAIEEFSMLGAGFKIAMRDLEIRGAGNILGPEQSGHIAAVGYEMYCELLEQAVKHLRNEPVVVPSQTSVELGLVGVIPKAYIPSDARRLDAYRRLTLAQSPEQLDAFERELQEAYGPAPPPVRRLLDLAELRIAANRLEVRALAVRDQDVVFRTPDPGRLESLLREAKGTVRILPPKPGEEVCEVYYRPPESYFKPQTLLAVLRKHLCAPRPAAADGAPAHDGPAPTGAAAEGRHRSSPGR